MKTKIQILALLLTISGECFGEEIPSNELVVIKNPTFQGKPLILDVGCVEHRNGTFPDEEVRTECFWYKAQAWALCEFMGLGKPVPSLWESEWDPREASFDRNMRLGIEITCNLYTGTISDTVETNCKNGFPAIRERRDNNMITQLACLKRLLQ